ncbi:hypothetical protein PRZ03_10285 [Paucibacter sp. hw8]|uniref:Uncharacterized protein n=1 Tax=Roseateles albus TaxID=2987525 RepID=A0ABT5KDF2_9BURK|nr:hypothetical protein [Roseateles albus]
MTIFPTGLFFSLHWALGVAAIAIAPSTMLAYVSRKYPLVAGPKHG